MNEVAYIQREVTKFPVGPGSTGVRFICILSPDPCSSASLYSRRSHCSFSLVSMSLFVCVCTCAPPRVCTHTYMSHSCIEGQRITGVEEPVLSFYHVDPKDGTQAVRLSLSTSTPSHRAGPAAGFSWPGLHW